MEIEKVNGGYLISDEKGSVFRSSIKDVMNYIRRILPPLKNVGDRCEVITTALPKAEVK